MAAVERTRVGTRRLGRMSDSIIFCQMNLDTIKRHIDWLGIMIDEAPKGLWRKLESYEIDLKIELHRRQERLREAKDD